MGHDRHDCWNVPSETVYDADGRVMGSILPPGDPVVDPPLVTETAYDARRLVAFQQAGVEVPYRIRDRKRNRWLDAKVHNGEQRNLDPH